MLTKDDLVKIRKEIKNELSPLKQDIKTTKSDISKIRKDLNRVISFFDHEYLEIRNRVDRIEQHLGLSPILPS